MMTADYYLLENKRRNILPAYDQKTGEGCLGERVLCEVAEINYTMRLPIAAMDNKIISAAVKAGSIKKMLMDAGVDPSDEDINSAIIAFCEERYQYDFEFYAVCCITINDKETGRLIPFRLNGGQRKLLSALETQRLNNVPIRIMHLKTRQYGGSTLIQQYMNWIQLVKKRNWNSVICAHTKDAAINIRSIYETSIENMLPIGGIKYHAKPFKQTQNIKCIPERGCRTTVGTAQEPDSVRSQDAKMVHFSEVAFYPNTDKLQTDKLISSIVSTIPRVPLTLVAHESTANGVGDFFYNEWTKAESGRSSYAAVFVAWWEIEMYSEKISGCFYNYIGKKVDGNIHDFIETLTEDEKMMFGMGCTLENINWYRGKLSDMTSIEQMHQEFPSTPSEAFITTGMPVFRRSDIEKLRSDCREPEAIGDISGKVSLSYAKIHPKETKDILTDIVFTSDEEALKRHNTTDPRARYLSERNKLRIWSYPEKSENNISGYRYIVSVDTGGRGESADFSCITVIDRYWMLYDGAPEVVARWKGHIDHDQLVWLAAQIAAFYNNALLVFESNTEEMESRDGDPEEFIFDTISEYYKHLYSRTPADKIKEGAPAVWGFHTNRKTKTMIIDEYTAIIRDSQYVEPDDECLNEALMYEKRTNGKFEAREGYHDDILMSTMIGLYISYHYDRIKIVKQATKQAKSKSTMVI